jgi:hypothetical protein
VTVLSWLLFGGAPLLAGLWVLFRATMASEQDRLTAIGGAASQGCYALIVLYGLAGALLIAAMLLWRVG